MSSPDDEAYHKSVQRMVVVLATIVIVIFAAIYIPPLLNPIHEEFAPEVSVNSPYGFSLNLSVNATRIPAGGSVEFTVWLNNTSRQIDDVTAQSAWVVSNLTAAPCATYMPVRIGVMLGYFTADNFSLGTVLPLSYPSTSCSANSPSAQPSYFLFEPLGTEALMNTSAGIVREAVSITMSSDFFLMHGTQASFQGVMTAVAIDEWGDSVLTHFAVD